MSRASLPSPRLLLAAFALLSSLPACDEGGAVTLLFDRGATDLTRHVFPSDQFHGAVVLDGFSEAQLELLPFLAQLRYTAQLGWAPTTAVRLPFTAAPDEPDRWIDVATVSDAVRLYRVDGEVARVTLGEVRLQQRTNALLLRPRAPWSPGRYAVVVLADRLRTRGGATVGASNDQRRVRRDGDPETDDDFAAVDAAEPELAGRDDTLAFFTFTVADATSQMKLLKAYVSGLAPVSWQGTREELLDITSMAPDTRELAVGGAKVVADSDPAVAAVFEAAGIAALPKDKIGKIVGGAISTPVFLSDPLFDPLELFFNSTFKGAVRPQEPFNLQNALATSAATPTRLLPYLMFVPKQHAPKMPVIIAIHGIGRSKEDWFAFANAACATGHALIAIDLYQHGDRQEKITPAEGGFSTRVDPVLAKSGVAFPDPFVNPTFLARTRDKLRQSIVDQLALVRLVSAGDGANPLIDFDGDGAPDDLGPIRVAGMSLGAILATEVVAVSPEVDRALLDVVGSHLSAIIADAPRLTKDFDPLIYATANATGIGTLAGSPRYMIPDGPERELYNRVAETILAPVDPASYAAALVDGSLGASGPRLLVQFALGDDVVTNLANRRFAQALAAGGEDGEVVSVAPELFPLDLELVAPGVALPPIAITQFEGDHGMMLDFVDPEVTAAVQKQAALFFASP